MLLLLVLVAVAIAVYVRATHVRGADNEPNGAQDISLSEFASSSPEERDPYCESAIPPVPIIYAVPVETSSADGGTASKLGRDGSFVLAKTTGSTTAAPAAATAITLAPNSLFVVMYEQQLLDAALAAGCGGNLGFNCLSESGLYLVAVCSLRFVCL